MKLLVAYNFEISEGHVRAPNFYRACVSEIFPPLGISATYLPDVRRGRLYRVLRRARLGASAAQLLAVAWWLVVSHRDFDVAVGWSTYGLLVAALRAVCRWRRPRTCVILYQLDLHRGSGLGAWLRERVLRLASRGCDLLLTLDREQADHFQHALGRRSGTTVALRYGVAANWYDQQRERIAVSAHANRRVFCPGGAHRDERTMREAVADLDVEVDRYQLAASGPTSVTHQRVGTARWHAVVNAPYEEYLRACLESALVVIPVDSHDKPVGLTALLECMALGRAVIITRGASSRDYIDDGTTGLLCEPGEPAQLRELIQQLLSDPQRAASIGEAATREAHGGLGLTDCGRRFGRLLLQLHQATSLARFGVRSADAAASAAGS